LISTIDWVPLPVNDRHLFQARAQIACLRHSIFFDRKLIPSILSDSPNRVWSCVHQLFMVKPVIQ
jgi:hypothetical protein